MTSHPDETPSERAGRALDKALYGKPAFAVLAVVLLVALVTYLVD